jgi:hypothetical protein
LERLKLLQDGTVAFQETNLEWHHKGYLDEFQKRFAKAFGAARVECSTTKDKFETSLFKPGGTASAALGEMANRVGKTGRDETGSDDGHYIQWQREQEINSDHHLQSMLAARPCRHNRIQTATVYSIRR